MSLPNIRLKIFNFRLLLFDFSTWKLIFSEHVQSQTGKNHNEKIIDTIKGSVSMSKPTKSSSNDILPLRCATLLDMLAQTQSGYDEDKLDISFLQETVASVSELQFLVAFSHIFYTLRQSKNMFHCIAIEFLILQTIFVTFTNFLDNF